MVSAIEGFHCSSSSSSVHIYTKYLNTLHSHLLYNFCSSAWWRTVSCSWVCYSSQPGLPWLPHLHWWEPPAREPLPLWTPPQCWDRVPHHHLWKPLPHCTWDAAKGCVCGGRRWHHQGGEGLCMWMSKLLHDLSSYLLCSKCSEILLFHPILLPIQCYSL